MFDIVCFLASHRLFPVFKALFFIMIRLAYGTTVSVSRDLRHCLAIKSSAVSHPVIIRLACSKATSYSNFFFVTRSELWVSLLGIFLYYINSMLSFHLLTSIFVFLGSVTSLEFISSVRVMTK